MSDKFRLNYDRVRRRQELQSAESVGAKEEQQPLLKEGIDKIPYLRLTLSDGSIHSLVYSDLRKIEFIPDENIICLCFFSGTYLIKGERLESLHHALENHLPKILESVEERYAAIGNNENGPLIKSIEMKVESNL